MMKQYKRTLLLSSVVTLLPIVIGLLFWKQLPDELTTHWGVDGIADGWTGKAFAVFGMPVLILLVHWLCILLSAKFTNAEKQNPKIFRIVLWICPMISLFINSMLYAIAFLWC